MSTFSIITTALSSLQAHFQAMNTAGHNVANVNTPGFRRQEAIFSSRSPYPPPGVAETTLGGLVGTGVEVSHIRRAQDGYLGIHLRTTAGQLGQWDTMYTALREIEAIIAPTPGGDLGTLMDRFWDAWQTLSTRPEDLSARMQVRSEGISLAAGFRDLVQKLNWQAANLDVAISGSVEEINRLAEQTAELNRRIAVAIAEGKQPNDLLDQRDTLLMRLSRLTGATLISPENAQPILNLGGRPLVQGEIAFRLSTTQGASGHLEVMWEGDGAQAAVSTGELGAQLQMQQQIIPQYLAQLDTIASTLASEVNALHQTGFGMDDTTGLDFFTAGSTAGNISVDAAILGDIRMIAAASAAASPGDGSLALSIAGLRSQPVLAGGDSLGTAWRSLIGRIGSETQAAQDSAKAAQLLHDQLNLQQQSLAGVSLDEEMANMIQYQHAYDAAARVLTTADEMIATIIERMAAPI
jgi:flagellar hook-associated protein 1 FlgK